jgi:cobalamin synthase
MVTNLKALEIWTTQTLCDIGILLSILSFLLHIGRPYFDRILGRFTLRVAADIWWVVYIVLRDGTLLFAALIGFSHLNLDVMADIKVGLPFVPLGTVALAAALLIKVFRNAEDINRSLRLSTWLVTLGAVLNTVGYVFVMEGPGEEYAASKSAFWKALDSWKSDGNPELATITFYVAFSLLAVMVALAIVSAVRLLGITEKEGAEDV